MTQQQFPDPEERARIIARRNQLNRDLIEYLVMHSSDEQEAREKMNPLVREYGFPEVYRMLQKISPRLNPPADPDEDERQLYQEYVGLYGRFGGERPFLSQTKYHRLNHERALLIGRTIFEGQQLSEAEQRRLDELSDLLLSEPFLWDDLVPEDPPRRKPPSSQPHAAESRKIGRNEPCPCGSGRKYKHCHGK